MCLAFFFLCVMYTITSSGYTYAVFYIRQKTKAYLLCKWSRLQNSIIKWWPGRYFFHYIPYCLDCIKKYGIGWRKDLPGSPYHMIIHALQRGKSRLNNDKHTHFLGCKNIDNTNVFFIILKINFYLTRYILKNTFKILKDDLKTLFQLESRMQSMYKSYGRAGRRDLFSILFRFT